MSNIRVMVNGARGRMGQATVAAVAQAPGLELVAKTDIDDDLAATLASVRPDVCVDFTHPSAALPNTLAILNAGVRPVVGTTGFSDADVEQVRQLAAERELGALIVPNFAIGAVLMMRFARQAAPFFSMAEIVELHHDRKADSPSGTALATARAMAAARETPFPAGVCPHELIPGSRGGEVDGIRLHSVRMPGFLAHQEVIFGDPGQTLTIRHDTQDRACFMPGVIRAVRAVMTLRGLLVGLETVLFPE